jgi:predicted GH43/DUF377 family glycosyl hydrolase
MMSCKFSVLFTVIICSVVVLLGCNSGGSDRIDNPVPQWQAYSGNPIINYGQAIPGAFWNDPCVLLEDSKYVMYLTSNTGAIGGEVLPFRASSSDGVAWEINTTPLLASGTDPADFDYGRIETPSVIFFNGEYHMYYSGIQTDETGPIAVGHAVSPDGITWTKATPNPVLSPTGNATDWNGVHVGEPGAVVFNGEVYLYFTAGALRGVAGEPNSKHVIGLSISDDGYNFGPQMQVLEQGNLYPAADGYEGYSTPAALVYNDRVHLFYDVAQILQGTDWTQVALHHAVSENGIDGWVEDAQSIFVYTDFSWTQREIRAPHVIIKGTDAMMWFAGDDFLARQISGIGLATAGLDVLEQ